MKMTMKILLTFVVLLVGVENSFAATLAWDPMSSPVEGYVIYWGIQNGVFPNSINVGNKTTYAIGGLPLQNGKKYFFVVRGYNSAGESENSNTVFNIVTAVSVATWMASNIQSINEESDFTYGNSSEGTEIFNFGSPGDIARFIFDYDNDGITENIIVRKVNGLYLWAVDMDSNGKWGAGDISFYCGEDGDTPFIGKFQIAGGVGYGVFRPTLAICKWYIDFDRNEELEESEVFSYFGGFYDKIVIGDWNGDTWDEIGIARDSGGQLLWALDKNSDFRWSGEVLDSLSTFGVAGDMPFSCILEAGEASRVGIIRHKSGQDRNSDGIKDDLTIAIDVDGSMKWSAPDIYYDLVGLSGAYVVIGDTDGDGVSNIAVVLD